MLLELPLAWISLFALNTIVCYSEYHSMSFLVALDGPVPVGGPPKLKVSPLWIEKKKKNMVRLLILIAQTKSFDALNATI